MPWPRIPSNPWQNIWPGALVSLARVDGASAGCIHTTSRPLAHYSVLYGSIGAVIVVLIWLNLSAFTLILGAEMNGVLISMRKDRLEQDTNVPKA
ncbi:MAG: YhjD/YihY/BrkB family envelope integrity protein [Dysosmobacter sp.]